MIQRRIGAPTAESDGTPSRLYGTAALRAHLTLAIGLVLCVLAFWFEFRRAEGGNSLSWAYVFEWPLLGGFAVYMWWKVLNPDRVKTSRRSEKLVVAPEYEGMLAAWQDHQEELKRTQLEEEQERQAALDEPEDRL